MIGVANAHPILQFLNRKKEKPAGLLRSGFRVVIRSQIFATSLRALPYPGPRRVER